MDWQNWFEPHILERGRGYYLNDCVEDYEADLDHIQAVVQGSNPYEVRIDFCEDEILGMECDCPYAEEDNYCKHMAALLYAMDAGLEKPGSGKSQSKQEAKKATTEIDEMVKAADEAVVKKFLAEVLNNDERLHSRFKTMVRADITPEDVRTYKRQIDDVFVKYGGDYGYIDYHHIDHLISDLADFLDKEIAEMLDNGHYAAAFELASYIFVEINSQEMDDSEGETFYIADRCRDVFQKVVACADAKLKEEIIQWCMDRLNGSIDDFMEDYLQDLLFLNFKEEDYLEVKRQFILEKIDSYSKLESSWSNEYHVGMWTIKYIELLKDMKVSQEEIWLYCEENIHLSDVRQYYVDDCISKGRYDKAIQLLEEGKVREASAAGTLASYSEQLKNLYKRTGKMSAYENELWSLVLNHRSGDLDSFKELKQLYSEEEWVAKREYIFEKLPKHTNVDKLYKEEKLYDRLLKSVLASTNLYELWEYESCLKKLYPEELLDKYESVLQQMAVHPSKRKYYRSMVSILRKMKAYPGGGKRVKQIVEQWRTIYRRRPAMMEELNALS